MIHLTKELWEVLFNSIDEGFCIIEMIFDEQKKPIDYRFLLINASFERQTGLIGAVGKRMREFAPDHEAHWFEIYGKIALTGESVRFENRAEQLHRWYDVYAFRFGEPKDFQVAILFNDITERKHSEETIKLLNKELADRNEKLAFSNKELEQFVYIASHDLQEPLRTISNFVGLIEKKYSGTTDKDAMQYLGFIVDAAGRMKNLIKDLLDLARIGTNVTFTMIDCNEVFKEVMANMAASIKESNAKITVATLPVLKGNTSELKQVFQNLISNAIKFHKKNVIPEINITVEDKNTEYLFAVQDNGIGIEEQSINKLFVIFQRLNTATEYQGTGIGLATCQKIVALHHGKIWVESKFGEGSTFYFTLPKEIESTTKAEYTFSK